MGDRVIGFDPFYTDCINIRRCRRNREVGAKIRKTITELGGTMPEELPVVEDIKKLETKQKKALKGRSKPTG